MCELSYWRIQSKTYALSENSLKKTHTNHKYSHDKTYTVKQLTWMLSIAYLVRELYSHHQSSDRVTNLKEIFAPYIGVQLLIAYFAFNLLVCRPRRVPVGEQHTWWPARHASGPLQWPGPPVRFPGSRSGSVSWSWPHNHKARAVALAIRLHQSGHAKSAIAGRVKWV